MKSSENVVGPNVLTSRPDCRDTSANNMRCVANHCRVADPHAFDIGDGVGGTGWERTGHDTEVAETGTGHWSVPSQALPAQSYQHRLATRAISSFGSGIGGWRRPSSMKGTSAKRSSSASHISMSVSVPEPVSDMASTSIVDMQQQKNINRLRHAIEIDGSQAHATIPPTSALRVGELRWRHSESVGTAEARVSLRLATAPPCAPAADPSAPA